MLYEKGKARYRDTGLSVAVFNKKWLLDGKDINDIKQTGCKEQATLRAGLRTQFLRAQENHKSPLCC